MSGLGVGHWRIAKCGYRRAVPKWTERKQYDLPSTRQGMRVNFILLNTKASRVANYLVYLLLHVRQLVPLEPWAMLITGTLTATADLVIKRSSNPSFCI